MIDLVRLVRDWKIVSREVAIAPKYNHSDSLKLVESLAAKIAAQPAPKETMHMSFFTSIVNAEHSTVAWFAKKIQAFEKAEPTIAKVVDTGATYIGSVLEIALDAAGQPGAATVVGSVVSQAHQDVLTANALVTDFGATPTAASLFNAVKSNLSGLLTAGHITNTQSVAAVTKAINEVGVLGTAVGAAVTAISAAAATPIATTTTVAAL